MFLIARAALPSMRDSRCSLFPSFPPLYADVTSELY